MKTHLIGVAALLLVACFPLPSGAEATGSTIRLSMLAGRPYVDGVFLNDHGPYRFLLDTGSQSNQLEVGLAHKLGLTSSLHITLYTPSGSAPASGGTVEKVSLGPMQAAGQEFLFTAFDGLRSQASDVRGVLGQEFLAHFDYTFDLRHKRLILGDEPPAGTRIAVRLIFGRMALSTSVGELILDSGAEMVFLFHKSPRAATARVLAASGMAAPISFDNSPEVNIGGRIYQPAQAAFHSVPEAEESGLLPLNLFDAVFISNSKRYVVLNPRTRSSP